MQEVARQVAHATGISGRLNRDRGTQQKETIVEELASAVKMLDFGMTAKLRPETMKDLPAIIERMKENPQYAKEVMRDVNRTVGMIKKAESGEKIQIIESPSEKRQQEWAAQFPIEQVPEKFNAIVMLKDDEGKWALAAKPDSQPADRFSIKSKKNNALPPLGDSSVKRWLIVSLMSLILWVVSCQRGYCQIVTSNPGEYTILATGNALINNTVKSETKAERETAVLQNAMAGEFTKMAEWERQYNSYLKTATGYASAIKAATHIYDDGVRVLITLNKLRQAANNNPQGVVATLDMNNLYMETVTEMVSVFTLLKNAVAKGGEENMLTGSERSKTLWELEDKLSAFSHKLQLLYFSIRHYRMGVPL